MELPWLSYCVQENAVEAKARHERSWSGRMLGVKSESSRLRLRCSGEMSVERT